LPDEVKGRPIGLALFKHNPANKSQEKS